MKDEERSRRDDQVNDKKRRKKKKEKRKRHRISKRDGTASCAGSTPYVTSVPLQGKNAQCHPTTPVDRHNALGMSCEYVDVDVNVSVTHAARRYARGYQIIVSRLWPGSHIYASPVRAAHVKYPNISQMANQEKKQNKNDRV